MKAYYELGSGLVIETDTPGVWADDPKAKRLSAAKGKQRLKDEARKELSDLLKPGDTVHCVLRHVSRSGMCSRIDMYIIRNSEAMCISSRAAHLLDYTLHKDGGLVVSGCGMDMGWHLVYNLSMALFCPDKYNHDAAYALNSRWL